jgi:hypothetical protein
MYRLSWNLCIYECALALGFVAFVVHAVLHPNGAPRYTVEYQGFDLLIFGTRSIGSRFSNLGGSCYRDIQIPYHMHATCARDLRI